MDHVAPLASAANTAPRLQSAALHAIAAAFAKRADGRADMAAMLARCLPNTLETTTELLDDGTTFVFTGDIPALWLRDSAAQVRPYVRPSRHDPTLRRVVSGLIRRHARYLLIDAYANAFNREPASAGHQADRTEMGPWIWERKFELDSLCYPVQLCQDYWAATGDRSIFDAELHAALARIVAVMRVEQHHDKRSPYRFERLDCPPTDTLPNHGRGLPTAYTGMVWSGFRPSDDACAYGYHVPSNMFAVVALGHLAAFAREQFGDTALAADALALRAEIDAGIQAHALVDHPRHGRIYAYEVDGNGGVNLMDDANVPSLLAIPYLGYRPSDDPDYRRTRAFVLSRDNPYYYEGRHAQGVGSPHTPPGYIWPIALAMQGLTAADAAEREALLSVLTATTGGTGYAHESFDPDDPTRFTRGWFAWANSMYAALALRWAGLDA